MGFLHFVLWSQELATFVLVKAIVVIIEILHFGAEMKVQRVFPSSTMATAADLKLFSPELNEKVTDSKILMVGAGGIGCELLKNLVLTGFRDIDIVDLDTIDVSNLNRQFLFQKAHVGKSKAKVARESALKINPSAKITAHHTSITSLDFGPEYFKSFDIVLNALDNRAARNHVNRMCLASNVPLVESGTAGYLGQVTVIKKGVTECYECQPQPAQKTYPGCTIRNTPSEPVHCIVWAKHLFNQLFGESDPDEDVSPDTADPEAVGDAGGNALNKDIREDGNVERVSTRSWAASSGYDTNKLFHKFFHDDIKYLLSMDRLWQKRRPPTPLDVENLPDAVAGPSWSNADNSEIIDQRIWSVRECADVLKRSVEVLKAKLDDMQDNRKGDEQQYLVWDKDDDPCMDFVTACANVRAHIFGIPQKSRFEVKSIAGNIIPAIATTNAIIAGLVVMEAFKVLQGRLDECRTVYLNRNPSARNKLLVPAMLDKPNPKCYVCSKPEVILKLNVNRFTVGALETKVLKEQLHMVAPDVTIDDGKGTILISSEEGETEGNNDKALAVFGIHNGSRLVFDDFHQNYQLAATIYQSEELPEGVEFQVVGDLEQLKAAQDENGSSNNDAGASTSTARDNDDDILDADDVDLEIMEVESPHRPDSAPKRRLMSEDDSVSPVEPSLKKKRQ